MYKTKSRPVFQVLDKVTYRQKFVGEAPMLIPKDLSRPLKNLVLVRYMSSMLLPDQNIKTQNQLNQSTSYQVVASLLNVSAYCLTPFLTAALIILAFLGFFRV